MKHGVKDRYFKNYISNYVLPNTFLVQSYMPEIIYYYYLKTLYVGRYRVHNIKVLWYVQSSSYSYLLSFQCCWERRSCSALAPSPTAPGGAAWTPPLTTGRAGAAGAPRRSGGGGGALQWARWSGQGGWGPQHGRREGSPPEPAEQVGMMMMRRRTMAIPVRCCSWCWGRVRRSCSAASASPAAPAAGVSARRSWASWTLFMSVMPLYEDYFSLRVRSFNRAGSYTRLTVWQGFDSASTH